MTDSNRAKDQRPAQAGLKIQTPCPKTWDMLEGDGRKRFCSECSLHVHNSEALTRAEAHALVAQREGRVCMRIVKDDAGAALFLDSPAPVRRAGGALSRVARWALAAGTGLLVACRPEAPAPVDSGPADTPPGGTPEAMVGIVCPVAELGDVVYPDELGKLEAAPDLVGEATWVNGDTQAGDE